MRIAYADNALRMSPCGACIESLQNLGHHTEAALADRLHDLHSTSGRDYWDPT